MTTSTCPHSHCDFSEIKLQLGDPAYVVQAVKRQCAQLSICMLNYTCLAEHKFWNLHKILYWIHSAVWVMDNGALSASPESSRLTNIIRLNHLELNCGLHVQSIMATEGGSTLSQPLYRTCDAQQHWAKTYFSGADDNRVQLAGCSLD